MIDKIRFMIGRSPNSTCAECQMVLEYSIKKHCSMPYEIYWMTLSNDPDSFWYGWNTDEFDTPFSSFRYAIPEFLDFEGKAIYQDDDQMWLSDPKELWNYELSNDKIMTGKSLKSGEIRHCVSLIDCKKCQNLLPPINRRKNLPYLSNIMRNITSPLTEIVDNKWNCYDGEDLDLEDIGVLHFTDMSTNPGVAMAIRRLGTENHWYNGELREHRRKDAIDIFHQYYNEALKDGFKLSDYIPKETIDYKIKDQSNYVANNGWDVTKGE